MKSKPTSPVAAIARFPFSVVHSSIHKKVCAPYLGMAVLLIHNPAVLSTLMSLVWIVRIYESFAR
jgi:hypothetical protein